jgi:hypothetical protein
MTQEDFLVRIGAALSNAGISFMVTGAHASSYHGRPRSTNDADFVIEATAAQLDSFMAALGQDIYVSAEAAHEALSHHSMFNVIAFAEGWKADLIVRKERPFSIEEFGRRRLEPLYATPLPVASPEDTVLAKLEWNKITPSQRQVQDALGVVVAQGPKLDLDYMKRWAIELGVAPELEQLLNQAKTLGSGGA